MKAELGELPNLHIGDFGDICQLTLTANEGEFKYLVNPTALRFIFCKPNGQTITVDAQAGENGIATYQFPEGFLNAGGIWRVQAFLQLGLSQWHSSINSFLVNKNLREPNE